MHTSSQECGLDFWRPTTAGRWWLTFELTSVLSSFFRGSRKEGLWKEEARGGVGSLSERTGLSKKCFKKDSGVHLSSSSSQKHYSIFIQQYVLSVCYKVGTILSVLRAELWHEQDLCWWDVYVIKPLPLLIGGISVLYEAHFSSSVHGICSIIQLWGF